MLSQKAFDEKLQLLLPSVEGAPKVLLAVSGGVDSMTMAALFSAGGRCDIAVAHMNFSLRGEESDCDERFVADWCGTSGVRFFCKRVDTASYAAEHGISIEMAARNLRYVWFEELADEQGFDCIAVAHNLNDSVETMYLNLLRGTGLRGLCGIRAVNGRIIRPMLDFSRKEILEYATAAGVGWRTDSTNAESEFSRNRLRNNVFPELCKINPSFLNTAAMEAERFSRIDGLLSDILESKRGSLFFSGDGVLKIDVGVLKKEKYADYWLFRLLDRYGFNESQLEDILESLDGQTGLRFSTSSHIAVKARDFIKVYPLEDRVLPEVVFEVADVPEGFNPAAAPANVQYLDADKVQFPLSVREPEAGDRFRPLGMKGSKLVNDFLSEQNIDVYGKSFQTVVCDASGAIICVAPYRIDDRFKVTAQTMRLLEIKIGRE
ncbi:MAG: tRNA lysidine(34) synthetase TilS [Bacteroidales bacterium]|nr:tRNA lysidine(34) synthetase TilS [Candidatus Cacconaster scatequi]